MKIIKKFWKIKNLFLFNLIFVALTFSIKIFSEPIKELKTVSGVEMVYIPGGWYITNSKNGKIDKEQSNKIYVNPFYMDKYEVTQENYQRVMGENPSRWKADNNPVEQVTWIGAVKYCNTRSRLEGLKPCYNEKTLECDFSANGYRLPMETEWEFAARAGKNTLYFFGDEVKKLKFYAWFKENSGGKPKPVGQKLPNPFGLYDIYGNVWEWCNDLYQISPNESQKSKEKRVVRGGCWNSEPKECSSSYRYGENPGYSDICIVGYDIYGFRCVRSVK